MKADNEKYEYAAEKGRKTQACFHLTLCKHTLLLLFEKLEAHLVFLSTEQSLLRFRFRVGISVNSSSILHTDFPYVCPTSYITKILYILQ